MNGTLLISTLDDTTTSSRTPFSLPNESPASPHSWSCLLSYLPSLTGVSSDSHNNGGAFPSRVSWRIVPSNAPVVPAHSSDHTRPSHSDGTPSSQCRVVSCRWPCAPRAILIRGFLTSQWPRLPLVPVAPSLYSWLYLLYMRRWSCLPHRVLVAGRGFPASRHGFPGNGGACPRYWSHLLPLLVVRSV